MGLNPQVFPIYYSMGPSPFNLDGAQSGAVGSEAVLFTDLSNFPHMFMGLRINNVYAIPSDLGGEPTAQVLLYRALKEHVDGEQTVQILLAQQNITADRLLQTQLTGSAGINWHPFPVPFPMAGANNITVNLRRVTPYPLLGDQPVLPVARGSILAAVLRADLQTAPVRRVHG